jgi:cation:H+ antiporter
LAYYGAYVTCLFLAAQQHDALPAYSAVMISFVVPLTVVTLVAVMIRQPMASGPT